MVVYPILLRLMALLFEVYSVVSVLVNRTIDDQYGDEVTGRLVSTVSVSKLRLCLF